MYRLRIRNLSQLVTISNDGKSFKIGKDLGQLNIIKNGTIIINNLGLIEDLGPSDVLDEKYKDATFTQDLDGTGKSAIPGFVDGHTHPVWSGDRVHEFVMKLSGVSYLEIHKAGGGIGFTVDHTKKSSEEELEELLRIRLKRMLRQGTTLLEAKSGYGLELETEVKMLKVLHKVAKEGPVEIVSTYLGAHSVPKGSTSAAATNDIVANQIPRIKELNAKGELSVENIDVFLEEGVFNQEETTRILEAGEDAGLSLNFHGDELHYMNSGELAGELRALAVSHLEKVSDEGIAAMARRPSFAVLLPTTAYLLRLHPPPARKMIDAGVPVALGSDFNPNAHCLSMPFVMNLSCVLMHLSPNEALVAATLNSAGSLNRGKTHGSLEVGKVGDLIVINHSNWEHIIYEMVDPPLLHVVKKGFVVHSNPLVS